MNIAPLPESISALQYISLPHNKQNTDNPQSSIIASNFKYRLSVSFIYQFAILFVVPEFSIAVALTIVIFPSTKFFQKFR